MRTWLKILCAVDFSESSRAALEQAGDLAQRFGAALTLIHVREPLFLPDGQIPSARELVEAAEREPQDQLETWRLEAERLAGRPVEAVLVHGASGLEIVEAARDQKYDLIVTGTHSRKGLRRMLVGSVAEKIVREAPCPVLVARQRDERP